MIEAHVESTKASMFSATPPSHSQLAVCFLCLAGFGIQMAKSPEGIAFTFKLDHLVQKVATIQGILPLLLSVEAGVPGIPVGGLHACACCTVLGWIIGHSS